MRSINVAKAITVVTLLLVSATLSAADPDLEAQNLIAASQLRGAWTITLTPPEGGPPPFQMLLLCTRDGGVVQTDAGPPNPLQFSPGLGEWTLLDGGRYAIDYTQFEFDAGQNHIGIFRGRLEVTLDPKTRTLSGTARVRFYDLQEVLLFEGDGKIEGKRF